MRHSRGSNSRTVRRGCRLSTAVVMSIRLSRVSLICEALHPGDITVLFSRFIDPDDWSPQSVGFLATFTSPTAALR
jgi:hypothetical protein